MKLLTITIPCYNSEEYMSHAIESALVCGDELEILIVDDGSSDNTLKIAKQYEEKYPNIVGGSADLASSTQAFIEEGDLYSPENRRGRNIAFGVREHAMGAIANGISLYAGLLK